MSKVISGLIVTVTLVCASALLSACGGGGGGGRKHPSPTATVTSGPVTRMVVNGTAVHAKVTLKLSFTPAGSFSVQVSSSPATPFDRSVSVVQSGSGVYTLDLVTSTAATAGRYAGNATLNLCADAACSKAQAVSSVTVPFTIDVLNPGDAWPGDHLVLLSAWSGAPDWATFQGNAAHTGFVPVDISPDAITTRWQIAGTQIISPWVGYPQTLTASEGRLFLSGQQTIYARREHDASLIWQYDFSDLAWPSANPPAVSGGTVYVAAGQQNSTYMYAFDAAGGSLIFKSPMSSQWEHYLAPTVGPAGVYTNAGTYGGLYAFATTGNQLFFSPLAQTSMWTPAVDSNAVYVYTGGRLQVLDPVTGAEQVSITDPTFENYIYEIDGSPVLGAPGSVIVANYANSFLNGGGFGNTLTAFDVNGGKIAWQVAGSFPTTPAYHAGHIYVANQSPLRLEARAETNGSLEWNWVPPASGDTGFRSDVLLTNNLVFVSTNLSTYVLDLVSHQIVWSYPESGRLALSKNGVLYIQNGTHISAFNLK